MNITATKKHIFLIRLPSRLVLLARGAKNECAGEKSQGIHQVFFDGFYFELWTQKTLQAGTGGIPLDSNINDTLGPEYSEFTFGIELKL